MVVLMLARARSGGCVGGGRGGGRAASPAGAGRRARAAAGRAGAARARRAARHRTARAPQQSVYLSVILSYFLIVCPRHLFS